MFPSFVLQGWCCWKLLMVLHYYKTSPSWAQRPHTGGSFCVPHKQTFLYTTPRWLMLKICDLAGQMGDSRVLFYISIRLRGHGKVWGKIFCLSHFKRISQIFFFFTGNDRLRLAIWCIVCASLLCETKLLAKPVCVEQKRLFHYEKLSVPFFVSLSMWKRRPPLIKLPLAQLPR